MASGWIIIHTELGNKYLGSAFYIVADLGMVIKKHCTFSFLVSIERALFGRIKHLNTLKLGSI